jgi:gluconokinase
MGKVFVPDFPRQEMIFIVGGVTGSGKSTRAKEIADSKGWKWMEGDDFHTEESRAKMAEGAGLNDSDREPWIKSICKQVRQEVFNGEGVVISCSCLKKLYRDWFRDQLQGSILFFLFLDPPRSEIERRLESRKGHFATSSLLDSQFKDLEVPFDEIDCKVESTFSIGGSFLK